MAWQGMTAADVPAADRFDWFAQVVSQVMLPTAFETEDTAGFYAQGGMLHLGAAQVSRFSYSPLRSRRTPALIRKGDPEQYQLALVTKGSAWFSQLDAEARIGPGDLVVWDSSPPYASGSGLDGEDVEAVVLQIPKDRMPLPSQKVDRLLARRIAGGAGMTALLSRFLTALAEEGPDCPGQQLTGLGSMAVELAASALAGQLGADHEAPAELRAHAQLREIRAYIEHHLANPDLTPRAIAARHHISLRSLYALFEDEPEGVAATIRRRRLERCREDLARPGLAHEPIQTVAARWGFTSATAFSRTFRAAYGTTPRDYRADALGSSRG